MKVKHTIVAFAILLVLGGVFFYLNRLPERPGRDAIPKEPLFSFSPEDVEEFTLTEGSHPPATFRRVAAATSPSGGAGASQNGSAKPQWEIIAPEGIAADSDQIQSFLEEIVGMQGTPMSSDAPPQWSEYGLESPEKSYRFKLKDGKTAEFEIGTENPAGYARYSRRNKAAPVLLIDDIDNKALIEKTLFDLRDRRILPVKAEEIRRMELYFRSGDQQVSQQELDRARDLGLPIRPARIVMTRQPNDNWRLDEPPLRTDYGATNYLFSSVSGGRMRSLEEEKAASLARYGLDRPQIRLVVTTESGTHTLMVGNKIERGTEELYYAKNSLWPHVFTIPRTAYDQLNQDMVYYRNRYLYDFDQVNAKQMEIEGPAGHLRFERRGEEWYQVAPSERHLDYIKMGNFLNAIHSLRISSYPSDEPNRYSAYGLDRPWMKTTVTFGEANQQETVLYARRNNKFYAARQGEPSVYELSAAEPDNLEAKIKELLEEPEDQSAAQESPPASQ